jgi:transcriptional regulator with XRE-family HTH domain
MRSALALNDLTQAKLAKILDIAPSSLSYKLSGSIRFSAEEIVVMADALHISADQLLGRESMGCR